ncbi:MAG: hypothetical protein R3B90_02350 [Planctomycetaceae bacterium]
MFASRLIRPGALVALALLVGCGESRPGIVPIKGQVMIDGKPLTHGFIQVLPADARPASAKIGPDGRFTLSTFGEDDGCVPGTHPVTVVATESIDATSTKWHAPKAYADPATTNLKVNIAPGHEEITINLSWDGGEPFVEKFAAE